MITLIIRMQMRNDPLELLNAYGSGNKSYFLFPDIESLLFQFLVRYDYNGKSQRGYVS
jgi:hypothetical protein